MSPNEVNAVVDWASLHRATVSVSGLAVEGSTSEDGTLQPVYLFDRHQLAQYQSLLQRIESEEALLDLIRLLCEDPAHAAFGPYPSTTSCIDPRPFETAFLDFPDGEVPWAQLEEILLHRPLTPQEQQLVGQLLERIQRMRQTLEGFLVRSDESPWFKVGDRQYIWIRGVEFL